MSEEQTGEAERNWGARQPTKRRRWSGRKTVAALGIAVVMVGGGGAAVYAATDSDSSTQASGSVAGGPGMGGAGGPGGAGEVTAISATSISLTSDDGYAKTYAIDSSTVIGEASMPQGGPLQDGQQPSETS